MNWWMVNFYKLNLRNQLSCMSQKKKKINTNGTALILMMCRFVILLECLSQVPNCLVRTIYFQYKSIYSNFQGTKPGMVYSFQMNKDHCLNLWMTMILVYLSLCIFYVSVIEMCILKWILRPRPMTCLTVRVAILGWQM